MLKDISKLVDVRNECIIENSSFIASVMKNSYIRTMFMLEAHERN